MSDFPSNQFEQDLKDEMTELWDTLNRIGHDPDWKTLRSAVLRWVEFEDDALALDQEHRDD